MFEVIWYTGRANIVILLDGAGGGNVILISILPYVVVCADYSFFATFLSKIMMATTAMMMITHGSLN